MTLRSLPLPILLLGVLVFSISVLILRGDGAEPRQGRYLPQVVVSAPWGEKNLIYSGEASKPGEFGLFIPPEDMDAGPEKGPIGFTVSPNSELYVSDNLNERVQKFGPDGRFIGVVPNIRGGDDLIIDKENNIYVGLFDWTLYPKVEKYDQNGNLLMTYHLGKWADYGEQGGYRSVNHWGGDGNISCDNSGRLFIKYIKSPGSKPLFPNDTIPGNTEFIFQFGTTTQEFPFEQQVSTLQVPGAWGLNTNLPDWQSYLGKIKGNTYSLRSEANVQKGIAKGVILGREGLLGIAEGALYNVTTDKKNPRTWLILRYNYGGDLVSIYALNWIEGECEAFQTEYQPAGGPKKDKVFDNGNIYSYIHCKDGLKIIKWSPVEGGK